MLIGLPLAVAGLLILVFRYNKKGGTDTLIVPPIQNHKQMKRGKVMKKKSRFLTGLLSAVIFLSLCAMPAMAAEVHTNGYLKGEYPQKTTSVIDTKKKALLPFTNIFTQKMGKRLLLQVKNRRLPKNNSPLPAQVSRFMR